MSERDCKISIGPYGLDDSVSSVYLSAGSGYSRCEFLVKKEIVRDACLKYLTHEWPDAFTQPAKDRIYELEQQLAECRDK